MGRVDVEPDGAILKSGSVKPETAADQGPLPIYGFNWRRDGKVLLHYLLDSEVHTYAFSVSANAILSFIPFIVMLYTIAHNVFHSPAMEVVIGDMVQYLLPSNQDFIAQNLAIVAARQGVRVLSLLMILVSCTGIFLPLEVALNAVVGCGEEPQLPDESAGGTGFGGMDGVVGRLKCVAECGSALGDDFALFWAHR